MFIHWTAWTVTSAIIPIVTAFYPYEPSYRDAGKGQTRRDEPAFYPHVPKHDAKADPSTIDAPRRSITLPLRRVPKQPRENQYTILNSEPPKGENSVAVDQDGSDISYMVAVTIGSSKEEYHLLLDSAASNTWVMGKECTAEACGKHNTFGKGDSDTLKTDTTPFSITYGTGSVSGTIAEDTLHIGALSTPLTFGLATYVSQEFTSYPMDGILGLGKGQHIPGAINAPLLIETLATANLIDANLYGLHLSRAADGAHNGELTLGDVNTDRFDGHLNWLSARDNDNGFWEIGIADAGADGEMAGLTDRTAVIDTGTSFIFMPEDDAVALHELIDGSTQSGESFTVPCDSDKEIHVQLGSEMYAISTKDWIGGKAESESGGACWSNIFGRQVFGPSQWLLGDVFLKNVYTAFDFENGRVGFGVERRGAEETEASASASVEASAASASPTPTSINPLFPAGASSPASRPPASGTQDTCLPAESSSRDQPAAAAGALCAIPLSVFVICIAVGLTAVVVY